MSSRILNSLVSGKHITSEETYKFVLATLDGLVSSIHTAGVLTALRTKGESTEEIIGAARALRDRMLRVRLDLFPLLDTCGTGGDGFGTFNFSTLVAIICAAAGVPVAKHGNRAASSKCGSADLLETMGVKIEIPADRAAECLRKTGFAFLYAPQYHPALKAVAQIRKELGIRTIFNLVGPLANPAGAGVQLLGVTEPRFVESHIHALKTLGAVRSWVVFSKEGLDELFPGKNIVAELSEGKIGFSEFDTANIGIDKFSVARVLAGDPKQNAEIARSILAGETNEFLTCTLLNAGAALLIAGKVVAINEGIRMAKEMITTGKAQKKLDEIVDFTNAA